MRESRSNRPDHRNANGRATSTPVAVDPRMLALKTLQELRGGEVTLDELLTKHGYGLPSRDRNFLRQLLGSTLRHLGEIDAILAPRYHPPQDRTANRLTNIMRLGVTQLFFMDVSEHGAVDSTVNLARDAGLHKYVKLVNAVLRGLQRDGYELPEGVEDWQLNIPAWLRGVWKKTYGADRARDIARASLGYAKLDISVRDGEERAQWAEKLGGILLPTGTIRLESGQRIRDLPGYKDGKWWVQDAAAALPATLFGDYEGKTIYDLCAAPGGKTMQLAARGANTIAVDKSEGRLRRVYENLERVDLGAAIVTGDATELADDAPIADAVLLDAPCSATGTIRRHPDILLRSGDALMKSLLPIQQKLLLQADRVLAVGGELIYCTCSMQPDEGEFQIKSFLADHPNYARKPITADELGGWDEAITADGELRILPVHMTDLGGMDGFYCARLVKQRG
ncbi:MULTISPECIES: RsmB/NOP family class I SAM-dependent RNA methyltransferase [unclassified Thalassospira]|uniref:RsmB/NOP family class I SAM-dependent RNA methyltransferase n=1 Tax=unclassified Thalassospira TaxID=2648997 RepID=UPI000A23D4B4|nr:RsmB/NOP family class I SAM-dependent RNA methyltransferase [Thalassospira sp. MCCC 1A01428]OSQ43946.1 Sun protein [Thalassospira sp. MCCC 1A01428]